MKILNNSKNFNLCILIFLFYYSKIKMSVLKMDSEMMETVKNYLTPGLYKNLRDRIISMHEYTTFDILEALYIIYQNQTGNWMDDIEGRINDHTKRYDVPYYERHIYEERRKLLQDIRNDLYIYYIKRYQMPRSKEELDKISEQQNIIQKEYQEKRKLIIENERLERERKEQEYKRMEPFYRARDYEMRHEMEERERIEKEKKEREKIREAMQREIEFRNRQNRQQRPSGYDQVMYYYLTKDLI